MRPHAAKARARCPKCGSHSGIAGYRKLRTGRTVWRLVWCGSCGQWDDSVERATDKDIEELIKELEQ